jgi:uncharacterized protein (DUF1800 family)
MVDAMATRAQLAHLLRRATFGPLASEVDAAEKAGPEATVAALVHPTGADSGAAATPMPTLGADPLIALSTAKDRDTRLKVQQQIEQQVRTVVVWWLDRMVAGQHSYQEKLVFFWHGHWATSVQKVRSAGLMLRQQQTFRSLGNGDFGTLLKAMFRDPALVMWLDGELNTRTAPNENLAREVMELFTLGIGNYSETDVREAARALTGWQLSHSDLSLTFNTKRFDTGSKTILGHTGAMDTDGFADVLLGQPANATFLANRFWYRFASGEAVPADTLTRIVAAYRPARDMAALATAVFTDPAFAGAVGQLAKQPVEWAVGAMRQLGIRPGQLPAPAQKQLVSGLTALGQTPLAPPSVGGWPAGTAWLTTSAAERRMQLGTLMASHASAQSLSAVGGGPDALANLLVVDTFTDRSRAVLATAGKDPRKLIALGLASPEYAVC